MSDARLAFHDLRAESGGAYDARAMHAGLDNVERRVERARIQRALLTGVGALALAGAVAVVGPRLTSDDPVAPVHTPSATPAPTVSGIAETVNSLIFPCTEVVIVEGNPVGDLGGMEGWFNGTSDSQVCESRDEWNAELEMTAAHPATVLINTIDNTMIEAYSRIGVDALGVYATLTGDFAVPDPDPSWPAHSAVLLDTVTGEVVEIVDFTTMDGFDPATGEFDFSDSP